MKRIQFFPVAVLALALAVAGSAIGQTSDLETQSGMGEQDIVTGTVSAVSSTSLVITTENGQAMTLALGATVPKPASLKVGDQVRVEYMADPAGIFHASSISLTVSAPGQAPSSAQAMSEPEGTDAQPPHAMQSPADPYATSESGAAGENGSSRLPATASPVPLVSSLGLLSLGAGFAWSVVRRRASQG